MRRLDDREAYIKELQHFLARTLPDSGIVFENGIYDDATKNAVKRFKRENQMNEDTVVDRETYELLYSRYTEAEELTGRTLGRNDRGTDVLSLNVMLRDVAAQYSEAESPRATEYYSQLTENSVRALRKIFMMEDSADADPAFVRRLRLEYELTKETEEITR